MEEEIKEYKILVDKIAEKRKEYDLLIEDCRRIGKENEKNDLLWKSLEIDSSKIDENTKLLEETTGHLASLENDKRELELSIEELKNIEAKHSARLDELRREEEKVIQDTDIDKAKLLSISMEINSSDINRQKIMGEVECLVKQIKELKNEAQEIDSCIKRGKIESEGISKMINDFSVEKRNLESSIFDLKNSFEKEKSDKDIEIIGLNGKINKLLEEISGIKKIIEAKKSELESIEKDILKETDSVGAEKRILDNREADLENKRKILLRFQRKLEMEGKINIPIELE